MFWSRLKLSFSAGYSIFKVMFQIMWGVWRIAALERPIITIFGGAHFSEDNLYMQKAFSLAQRFVEGDISVVTGGGGGIMRAANCGADIKKIGKSTSLGIGVKELGEGRNPCVQEYFELDYFFARKWLLTHYSKAFVVFPGGFGTLDELAEILTLIHTNKLQRVPIVLIGKEYWHYLMQWFFDAALVQGLVVKEDLDLFIVADDLDEVFCLVKNECFKQVDFERGQGAKHHKNKKKESEQ